MPGRTKEYTTHAFAELIATVVKRYRNAEKGQKVILIGHSMGCSISALLTSSSSPLLSQLDGMIVGMVAICPQGAAVTSKEAMSIRLLSWIPVPLFDLVRWYDRRGGLNSASVTRVVGDGADKETRKLQMKYNEQSESPVFLRVLGGWVGSKGLPGKDVWSGIKIPLFLVAGDADTITPPEQTEQITAWLAVSPTGGDENGTLSIVTEPPPLLTTAGDAAAAERPLHPSNTNGDPPRTDSGSVIQDSHTSTLHAGALKTTIFPSPAAHGLLYSTSTVRILSGMIENFLARHVDQRLGVGWQLKHLTTSGKWDVKNLKKWQSVEPCSAPIGGIFRAMKTMREIDDGHCPKEFVRHFSIEALPDGVAAVVDISHESPVYHPQGLEDAGVEYHKFPTVSKEKPKAEEVEHFLTLVDKLRTSPKLQPSQTSSNGGSPTRPTIGIHCHYGFNRTGVFLVCYLVEREGYRLQDAIEEFAQKRPPGIKHEHFVNELYVRYAVKMERRGTVVGR